MDDLELCKAITLLELKQKFKGTDNIKYDERQLPRFLNSPYFLRNMTVLNPLEDKGLLFDLMVKYRIKIDYHHRKVSVEGEPSVTEVPYKTLADLPKAILICIFESQQ